MALGDPYVSPAELEQRLGRPDDGTYMAVLAAASRDLERYCGRQFNKTTTATARTFRSRDRRVVMVDDFHTTTDLVVKTDPGSEATFEVTVAAADYQLEPRDGVRDGVPGWPYERVLAVGTVAWPVNTSRPAVQVTAQWGWVAVPAAVKQATLSAAEAMLSQDAGPVVGEAIDGYSVQYARTGSDSPYYGLARYRRKVFGVA